MKKYLIYTDCHWSQNSSIIRKQGETYSVRLHNLINSISWAERLAVTENCDEVLIAGDFFDRPELNAMEITALQDVYFCDKPHRVLTGNHDANIASLDYSSAQVLKGCINADIITSVQKIDINDDVELYLIPYLTNDTILPLKSYLSNNNKKKIVLSHNDLAGIRYGKFISQSGFDVNDILDNCTLFINGHLHNGYIINDRIVLVGNLTGQNFNEDARNYDHYAYIMTVDGKDITLEPVINPYAFNFYKLYINKEKDLQILDELKNNAVVSVSCLNTILSKVESKLRSLSNVVEYKIIANYRTSEEYEESGVDFVVNDHLQQFIDYVQTKIEPSPILTEELTLLGGN